MSRPRSAHPTESRRRRSAADPHEATVSAVPAVGLARKRHSLTGRPVMITGAASGIGRALATRLSRSGSPVAIADVDEAGLKETAGLLRGSVLTRVLDVRDAADQLRFAEEVREWLPAP